VVDRTVRRQLDKRLVLVVATAVAATLLIRYLLVRVRPMLGRRLRSASCAAQNLWLTLVAISFALNDVSF